MFFLKHLNQFWGVPCANLSGTIGNYVASLQSCTGLTIGEHFFALNKLRQIAEKGTSNSFLKQIGAAEVFEICYEVGDDIDKRHARSGLDALGVEWKEKLGEGLEAPDFLSPDAPGAPNAPSKLDTSTPNTVDQSDALDAQHVLFGPPTFKV